MKSGFSAERAVCLVSSCIEGVGIADAAFGPFF